MHLLSLIGFLSMFFFENKKNKTGIAQQRIKKNHIHRESNVFLGTFIIRNSPFAEVRNALNCTRIKTSKGPLKPVLIEKEMQNKY